MTEFDQKLADWRQNMPLGLQDASVYVVDTLELAVAASKTLFGTVSESAVFAIYDRINARLAAKMAENASELANLADLE